MITLVLQCLIAILKITFGCISLAVARHREGIPEVQRGAWLITGIGFLLLGVSGTAHSFGAVWAFVSGPGTTVFDSFLRWGPVGNHGRNVLAIGLALVLALQVRASWTPGRRLVWISVCTLLAAAGLGSWIGWQEGPLQQATHYSMIAVLDSMQMIMFGAVLLYALRTEGVDRLLWCSLALYAIRQALNALWWSGAAWIRVPDAWHTSPREIQIYSFFFWVAMLLTAAYRLLLARRGIRVPTLLEVAPRREPHLIR